MNAQEWRRRWDLQQNAHEPEREQSFAVMLDAVEVVAGPPDRALDLACGTGSISERLLARFPDVQVTAVDLDPVTLSLAREAFADEERVRVAERDLRDPDWTAGLVAPFDAVLTATALHWLSAERLEGLYTEIAGLLRPGGVFANRDHFPLDDPRLAAAAAGLQEAQEARDLDAGAEHWEVWWDRVGDDPDLAPLLAERKLRFGESVDEEALHPFSWHAPRLRKAGFTSVGVVWRWGNDALLVGVR